MRRTCAGILVPMLILAGLCLGFRNRESDRVYEIGVMITDDTYLAPVEGFRQAMKELGYVEGQHITYHLRNAKLDKEVLKGFAQEFVKRRVDLIFTATYLGALSAKEATAANGTPVVFAPAGDPVETGLVQSIGSSGNNLTGISTLSLELTAKRLEMLTRVIPKARRVAVVLNPDDKFSQEVVKLAHRSANKLGLTLVEVHGRNAAEMLKEFEGLSRERVDAVFAVPDVLVNNQVATLSATARKLKLPYLVHMRSLAEKGALTSYGINTLQIGRQAARLADKILNGTRPAEIPIETPRKLELVINVGVAKEIGLAIPSEVLREADVILR
jgi:putative tryptophan/tyrosine transport system substrate-binding protein